MFTTNIKLFNKYTCNRQSYYLDGQVKLINKYK